MTEVPTDVVYRLTCSYLQVSGSRETRTEWDAVKPARHVDVAVELAYEAERRRVMPVPDLDEGRDLEVKLARDGRLLAVSNTTRGLLGDVIEATVGIASFAAGIAGAIMAPGLAATGRARPLVEDTGTDKTPAQVWDEANPAGDRTLLTAATAALRKLNRAVVAVGAEAAASAAPADVFRRLMAIRIAIAQVEEQIEQINVRRDAWHAAKYVTAESYEATLATDDLFVHRSDSGLAPEELEISSLETDDREEAVQLLEKLDVAVVEIRRSGPSDRSTIEDTIEDTNAAQRPARDPAPEGIYFRAPRSALVALYLKGAEGKLKLHSSEHYRLLDGYSRFNSIPLTGGGDYSVSVIFAADGTLRSFSVDEQSKLAAFVEALKGAPAQVVAGLGDAEKAVESWSSLRGSRATRELKELENRKKQLETEIANRGLASDAASAETLSELKDRLTRLKTNRAIGKIEHPEAPEEKDEQAETDAKRRAEARRLRTEVSIEEAQKVLAGFRDGDGD